MMHKYEQQLADAGITGITPLGRSDKKSGRTILEASIGPVRLSDNEIGTVLLYIETTKADSVSHRSVESIVAVLFMGGDRRKNVPASMVAERTYLPLVQPFPRIDQIVADLTAICSQDRPSAGTDGAGRLFPEP